MLHMTFISIRVNLASMEMKLHFLIFQAMILVFGVIIPSQGSRAIGMGSLMGSNLEQRLLPKLHQRYKNGGSKKMLSMLLQQGR